jgi:two-component system sensor histidine kinase PilS (NtrC family)
MPDRRELLRWLFVGRAALAGLVLVRAALVRETESDAAFTATLVVLLAFAATAYGVFLTNVLKSSLGTAFLVTQAAMDLLLITTLIHFAEAHQSGWAALYVVAIALYAALLPFSWSIFIALLGAGTYLADAYFILPDIPGPLVWSQIAIFVAVFVVVAFLVHRVRTASEERIELATELVRVRLEADEILRNIRSGVITVDGRGRLAFLNLAAEHLLGLKSSEHIGAPVLDELEGRSPVLHQAILTGIQKARRVSRAEGTARRADGRVVPIGLSTTTFARPQESTPSVTAIFTDISDLQQLQQLHLRAERLEAVAALSASLAHEIRNPLASIRSSLEQLAVSASDDPDDRILADLIVRESDRLSRLLNEFLDFARVRADQFEPVDLTALVRLAADLVRENPETGPGVEIVVSGEPTELEADEDLLHRIVSNLLLNAVQALNGPGRIEAIVDHPLQSDLPRGAEFEQPVRLRVVDDGPGIDLELQHRVFEPFVSGRPGGSGLGLAIVRRIIAEHGGSIEVSDNTPHGTRFTIELPC